MHFKRDDNLVNTLQDSEHRLAFGISRRDTGTHAFNFLANFVNQGGSISYSNTTFVISFSPFFVVGPVQTTEGYAKSSKTYNIEW